MKYVRNDAPPELRLRFHVRDKFGQDIYRTLDYDPETGIGHCYVPETDPQMTIEYFKPGGYVEIDGHVNPSKETLETLYASMQEKQNLGTDSNIIDQTIKKSEQDVRFNQGQTEQQQNEPVPEPEST